MKKLQELNKRTAPKSVMPEKVIQFGEGNFLRAFVDWILWNMNQKTDFNGSVVVVQPISLRLFTSVRMPCLMRASRSSVTPSTRDRLSLILRRVFAICPGNHCTVSF